MFLSFRSLYLTILTLFLAIASSSPQFWLNSQMQVSRNCRNSKNSILFFYKYSNHLTYNLEKSLFIAQEEVWEARDRLLAIGSTGTFHSNSGPIAEKMESSPIFGAVFKL